MIRTVKEVWRHIRGVNRQGHPKKEEDKPNSCKSEAAAIHRIADAIESARNEDKPVDQQRFFLEKIGVLFIFVTMVVTGYTAWIFYRTMVDAKENAVKAADDNMRSLHVAASSAIAARAAADSARDAIIENGRAWIILENPSDPRLAVYSGNRIITHIDTVNVGNTPALNVKFYGVGYFLRVHYEFVDGRRALIITHQNFRPNDTCIRAEKNDMRGVIWPHSQPEPTVGETRIFMDRRFFTGEVYYVYQACLIYDTFGRTHRTSVCEIFEGLDNGGQNNTEWGVCPGRLQQAD